MLAITRALVQDHKLLLIDEPSKGLAPVVVDKVTEALKEIKDHTTIVLVEQTSPWRVRWVTGIIFWTMVKQR